MERSVSSDHVALVTGGAHGIGAGIVRRLASLGARVIIADTDEETGSAVAKEVGGRFVRCDVGDFADNTAAVTAAIDQFGGLHIVSLNAGVSHGTGVGADFDPVDYRRVMAVNLDGLMFGAQAAIPALLASGGGEIVVTASIAGLIPTPLDATYGASKSGAVGLVRAMAPVLAPMGVRVNALCPGFADTAIVDSIRDMIASLGIETMSVETVVDGFMTILASDRTGECWHLLPGSPATPFEFGQIPHLRDIYPDPATVLPTRLGGDDGD